MQHTPSVDPEFEYFITVNRKLLALTGCLTFDVGPRTLRGRLVSKCFLAWNIMASIVFLSLQIYTLILRWADFALAMQVIGPFTMQIAGILKLFLLFYHRSELYELLDRCYLYWKYAETSEDRDILKEYAGRARRRSIVFVLSGILTVFLFEMDTIYRNFSVPLNGTVHLILAVEVTFERDSNVYPFVVTFEACAMMTMGINLMCNIIQQTFMLHGCAHFRLLQSWFSKFSHQELEKHIILDHEEIYRNIRMNLQHHQEILSYCQLLDHTFTWVTLIEVLTTVYSICFAGFNLMSAKTTTDVMKYSFQTAYGLLQILLCCWPASDLSIESMAVANAAYHDFGWVYTTKSIKKYILISIARAQKPVLMTAVYLSVLSLELFANVVRNAFSAYMVLRNFM